MITGSCVNISLGLESSSELPTLSQRAPSRNMPVTNAPSLECPSTCLTSLLVTSVKTCSLSSSSDCCWQQSCMMAVRKLCGLKSFEMSTTFGMLSGSAIQSFNCSHLSFRFESQLKSGLVEGKPYLDHFGEIVSMCKHS